jgi:hypothetical protein
MSCPAVSLGYQEESFKIFSSLNNLLHSTLFTGLPSTLLCSQVWVVLFRLSSQGNQYTLTYPGYVVNN